MPRSPNAATASSVHGSARRRLTHGDDDRALQQQVPAVGGVALPEDRRTFGVAFHSKLRQQRRALRSSAAPATAPWRVRGLGPRRPPRAPQPSTRAPRHRRRVDDGGRRPSSAGAGEGRRRRRLQLTDAPEAEGIGQAASRGRTCRRTGSGRRRRGAASTADNAPRRAQRNHTRGSARVRREPGWMRDGRKPPSGRTAVGSFRAALAAYLSTASAIVGRADADDVARRKVVIGAPGAAFDSEAPRDDWRRSVRRASTSPE